MSVRTKTRKRSTTKARRASMPPALTAFADHYADPVGLADFLENAAQTTVDPYNAAYEDLFKRFFSTASAEVRAVRKRRFLRCCSYCFEHSRVRSGRNTGAFLV